MSYYECCPGIYNYVCVCVLCWLIFATVWMFDNGFSWISLLLCQSVHNVFTEPCIYFLIKTWTAASKYLWNSIGRIMDHTNIFKVNFCDHYDRIEIWFYFAGSQANPLFLAKNLLKSNFIIFLRFSKINELQSFVQFMAFFHACIKIWFFNKCSGGSGKIP